MSWLAELLRKEHRVCRVCRLSPTHIYLTGDPAVSHGAAPDTARNAATGPDTAVGREAATGRDEPDGPDPESVPAGTSLCHACFERRLAEDLSTYEGRCLIFEPSLGPDVMAFHPLDGRATASWPAAQEGAVRRCLGRLGGSCDDCPDRARFAWIPVEPDANLWGDDCLVGLADGTLAPSASLCHGCAARRLVRSLDERGLYLEGFEPPRGGDGVLFCRDLID